MTPSHEIDTTLFQDAIDVPAWLEAERDRPLAERARRDRAIARELPESGHRRDPVGRVRAWWRAVARGETESRDGRQLDRIRTLVTLVMLAIGALGGTAIALAAFRYDGTYPVNVVRLLALLVVPQIVLAVLTLIAMPPRAPLLGSIQDALRAINPGALTAAPFSRLAPSQAAFSTVFGAGAGRRTAAGRFAKWQLLNWSQLAALAFNIAALVTAVMLITFTDLAFGWSTTLAPAPETVHRIVEGLAWPWQALVPAAVPDLALVEQSQFFRLDGGGFANEALRGNPDSPASSAPRALAGWWSFTVLAIAVYGLAPRILLFALTASRLRAATRALLLDNPRVTALLDRMAAPGIETGATQREQALADDTAPAAMRPAGLEGRARAVVWSRGIDPDAAADYARRQLGLEITALVEAGRDPELSADLEALDEIAGAGAAAGAAADAGAGTDASAGDNEEAGSGQAESGPLLVLTPAWEPPLLEFLDFIAKLRERAGDVSIIVTPVPAAGQTVSSVERETWAKALGRLGDPKVYVETGHGAGDGDGP